MCFTASVSFAASTILAAAGGASLAKAKRGSRMFASIPLVFAVQQFIEGLQWLTKTDGPPSLACGYAYLSFAFLTWPLYIPIAVYQLEHKPEYRKILRWFIVLGAAMTLYLVANILTLPLSIQLLSHGIDYAIPVPYQKLATFIYMIPVCGSFFMSSDRRIRWFGVAMAASAALAWVVWKGTFTSVWCFFGAALSFCIFLIVTNKNKTAGR